jgi:hypothetical protein
MGEGGESKVYGFEDEVGFLRPVLLLQAQYTLHRDTGHTSPRCASCVQDPAQSGSYRLRSKLREACSEIIGNRSTSVKLKDDQLLVVVSSPCDEPTKAKLAQLGKVS